MRDQTVWQKMATTRTVLNARLTNVDEGVIFTHPVLGVGALLSASGPETSVFRDEMLAPPPVWPIPACPMPGLRW